MAIGRYNLIKAIVLLYTETSDFPFIASLLG